MSVKKRPISSRCRLQRRPTRRHNNKMSPTHLGGTKDSLLTTAAWKHKTKNNRNIERYQEYKTQQEYRKQLSVFSDCDFPFLIVYLSIFLLLSIPCSQTAPMQGESSVPRNVPAPLHCRDLEQNVSKTCIHWIPGAQHKILECVCENLDPFSQQSI